jgi:hypothetical protein
MVLTGAAVCVCVRCVAAVTLEPGNREYLCRLAKQWSDLTYEEGATVEQIQEVNAKAVEYADRVIAMAPKVRAMHLQGAGCRVGVWGKDRWGTEEVSSTAVEFVR